MISNHHESSTKTKWKLRWCAMTGVYHHTRSIWAKSRLNWSHCISKEGFLYSAVRSEIALYGPHYGHSCSGLSKWQYMTRPAMEIYAHYCKCKENLCLLTLNHFIRSRELVQDPWTGPALPDLLNRVFSWFSSTRKKCPVQWSSMSIRRCWYINTIWKVVDFVPMWYNACIRSLFPADLLWVWRQSLN